MTENPVRTASAPGLSAIPDRWLVAAVLLGLALALRAAQPAAASVGDAKVLLFSFFRSNGEAGLFLAWSRDGLKWEEIKPPGKSFLEPKVGGKLMRDPCLALGPDGVFRMVWTTGWNKPPLVGYSSSTNLVDWAPQKAIPVMEHEPDARNVWAPELFYDQARREWLIFWASTIPGRFPETASTGDDAYNHRIYVTTTRDFDTFTPTKLMFNDGFNVIDATLLKAGSRYHLIVKDETKTPVKKHLRIAVGDTPLGPFGHVGEAFTGDWVEGPSAVFWGGQYLVYFDHYARPQYYGAMRSADLSRWDDISKQVVFPAGTRHGTALVAPEALVRELGRRLGTATPR